MKHSNIVGGSTAKRVINCPGSIKMVQAAPPQPSSVYADTGTLLHTAISMLINEVSIVGLKYNDIELTPELINEKLTPAIKALDEIDPEMQMQLEVDVEVSFGDFLPGVFGSADLIGRLGKRAIVLDWKFGDGVPVEAEENHQGLFYAAAAMRTPSVAWAFDGTEEIEIIIVQPPAVKRWVTPIDRVKQFEQVLHKAVRGKGPKPIRAGDWCQFCPARPTCPEHTGLADRVLNTAIKAIDPVQIGEYLGKADMLEGWIKDLRALAFTMLEQGQKVPGWKLVNKRPVRKWADELKAYEHLVAAGVEQPYKQELISPAAAEKLKVAIPAELISSVSSGSTLAPESDPRPEVGQLVNLVKSLEKLK